MMIIMYNKDSEAIEIAYAYNDCLREYNRWETKRRIRQHTEFLYYMKQRISGAIMAAIGIIAPFLLEGDATISLFALPLGIFLMITQEKIVEF